MERRFQRIAGAGIMWRLAMLAALAASMGATVPGYAQESNGVRQSPAATDEGESGPSREDGDTSAGREFLAEAPEPLPGVEVNQEVENPYGMRAAWQQGDWVTRGTFILLLIMSAATWYILFMKLWEQERMFKESKRASTEFWKSPSVSEGISKLREGSPYWYVAERGLSASEHHEGTLVERIDLSEWITMSVNRAVNEVGARLQSGLAVLATVGSTAPFVGLFGTVWGIYHALTAIGISGQASIDKVAGPVGEALIMTALGLAVAVPAVWAYNWLVRRNRIAMDMSRAFGADLHSVLLSGTRVGKTGTHVP